MVYKKKEEVIEEVKPEEKLVTVETVLFRRVLAKNKEKMEAQGYKVISEFPGCELRFEMAKTVKEQMTKEMADKLEKRKAQ